VDCGSIREGIEAYALGALEERERRRFDVHLASCPECADLARAYRVAVEHLAFAAPLYKAPRRLKDVVLGGAGGLRPRLTLGTFIHGSRWWAAAAAVFLAIAIGGLTWAVILSAQVRDLQEKNGQLAELTQLDSAQRTALLRLQSDLASTKTQQRQMASTLEEQSTLIVLALDPDLIPTELQGTSMAPDANCRYVWSTKQSLGALTCHNLPSIGSTLDYEFWATKGDKVVNLGNFTPRSDGAASLLVKPRPDAPGAPTNMWVTLEFASASAGKPSSEVVLRQAPPQSASR
jgi:hypothetical protein